MRSFAERNECQLAYVFFLSMGRLSSGHSGMLLLRTLSEAGGLTGVSLEIYHIPLEYSIVGLVVS